MQRRLTEKEIMRIVDDVLMHVYSKIEEDPSIRSELKKDLMENPHMGIVQLVSLPLYSDVEVAKQKMELMKESFKNQQCHNMVKASVYIEYVRELYSMWQDKYEFVDKNVCKNMCAFIDELKSIADDMYALSDEGEGFKPVDAKTFMENSGIRDELVDDLYDVVERYEYLDWAVDEFDDDFIESVRDFISKFATIFSISAEFKKLAIYLDDLYELLNKADVDSLEDDKKEMLVKLLKGIHDDLKKWAKNVIFEQTALDVHYLDDALAANVEQIGMMLGLKTDNNKESEEDVEFF